MPRYNLFVDRLLHDPDLLHRLLPAQPGHFASIQSIRDASDDDLVGAPSPAEPAALVLVRAALFYAHDAIDEAHRLAQDGKDDAASYLHGMIHRREGDFDNARYWFRRTGALGFFADLHRVVARLSPDMAKQTTWDPYLFTGLCEQDKFGDDSHRAELLAMQRCEFDAFLQSVWHKARGE